MVEASDNMRWYSGSTPVACLDNFRFPKRPTEKLLCLPFQDVNKIISIGTVPFDRVENFTSKPSMVVTIVPMNATTEVKSFDMQV